LPENVIVSTPAAYAYPLLVKQLFINSLSLYGDQEITYRGKVRYTYVISGDASGSSPPLSRVSACSTGQRWR
jgi:hypothetical protein